jgi:hypothetical protein
VVFWHKAASVLNRFHNSRFHPPGAADSAPTASLPMRLRQVGGNAQGGIDAHVSANQQLFKVFKHQVSSSSWWTTVLLCHAPGGQQVGFSLWALREVSAAKPTRA